MEETVKDPFRELQARARARSDSEERPPEPRAKVVATAWGVVSAADAYARATGDGAYSSQNELVALVEAIHVHRAALADLGLAALCEEARVPHEIVRASA
jgi:hypothetical protein